MRVLRAARLLVQGFNFGFENITLEPAAAVRDRDCRDLLRVLLAAAQSRKLA